MLGVWFWFTRRISSFFEEGIPGHGSVGGPLRVLQRFLRDNGFSFEAEGDVTRVHVGGALVEVRDEPGIGLAILASLPLPYGSSDVSFHVRASIAFSSIVAMLGRPVSYEVDSSIEGYPILRARIVFNDVEDLVSSLMRALSESRRLFEEFRSHS
jgi:hypothetical protein